MPTFQFSETKIPTSKKRPRKQSEPVDEESGGDDSDGGSPQREVRVPTPKSFKILKGGLLGQTALIFLARNVVKPLEENATMTSTNGTGMWFRSFYSTFNRRI